MLKYPSAWQSPHRASHTGVTKLLWILLSVCVLMTMVKPAQAAVEQVLPLSGGNQYIWYVFQPSAYPQLVKRDPLLACQAINNVFGTAWTNMSIADRGTYMPAYPYLHQYLCSGTESMNRPFSIIINPVIPPVKAVCPIAIPVFTFNPNTNFCERPICPTGTKLNAAGTVCEEQFSLTLSSAGDLEPSGTTAGDANSSKAMSVFVKSEKTGLAKSGAVVRVTLDAVAGSGGHLHNEPAPNARPKGTLVKGPLPSDRLDCTPTSGILGSYDCTTQVDGYAKFTYFAPIVSGTHAIIAACTTPICINNPQTAAVDVKVAGLSQIPESSVYALTEADGSAIGAKAGRHTDNHNMTPAAADALWRLAARYRFENRFQQGAGTTPRILYLNDASLPWGGVYDISTVWQSPHREHRRGTVVDVRANGATGAIPSGDIKLLFKRMLNEEVRMSGISFLHENPGTTNEHFHIRLLGRGE